MGTWRDPDDPTVYGVLEVDVTRALAYIAALREATGVHATLTHVVGKAAAVAIRERPEVNGIVRRGRHVYLRDSIDVFFQVAFEGGEDLSGAKIANADRKSVVEIANELAAKAEAVREHRDREILKTQNLLRMLPDWLRGRALGLTSWLTYDVGLDLRAVGIPFDAFGSVMVTNVGSFGLPLGLAPLVPFSHTPALLTLGAVQERPWVVGGAVVPRPVLAIGATFDHRVLDGFQAGKLTARFVEILDDPASILGDPHAG